MGTSDNPFRITILYIYYGDYWLMFMIQRHKVAISFVKNKNLTKNYNLCLQVHSPIADLFKGRDVS